MTKDELNALAAADRLAAERMLRDINRMLDYVWPPTPRKPRVCPKCRRPEHLCLCHEQGPGDET